MYIIHKHFKAFVYVRCMSLYCRMQLVKQEKNFKLQIFLCTNWYYCYDCTSHKPAKRFVPFFYVFSLRLIKSFLFTFSFFFLPNV